VIASEKYKQMEPGELLPPNKQKIDQLFANLKKLVKLKIYSLRAKVLL